MGDVADILGLQAKAQANDELGKILGEKSKGYNSGPKLSKKPKGMNREIFGLVGADGFVPSVQTNKPQLGFKSKRNNLLKGKWIWAPFQSSARKDDLTLHHWVKADVQYADYSYAKFNISMEFSLYTDDEYNNHLKSLTWTREESDHLMNLCQKFQLRWPLIADRYALLPLRNTEDMQSRYYFIVAKLKALRGQGEDTIGKLRENITHFNYEEERLRRYQLEVMFRK